MSDLLLPEYRFARLTALTPAWLREQGYTALLLDLDNTFLRRDREEAAPDRIQWIRALRREGVAVVFVSNSGGRRLYRAREVTGCPVVPWALKPWGRAFQKALGLLPPDAVALVVGDQLFTDVLGAHLAGLPAALVPSLGSRE
ncbi:MAG: YqeG family HAD IIIA-type phosphatase, partial [Succiniclasticum sp.]